MTGDNLALNLVGIFFLMFLSSCDKPMNSPQSTDNTELIPGVVASLSSASLYDCGPRVCLGFSYSLIVQNHSEHAVCFREYLNTEEIFRNTMFVEYGETVAFASSYGITDQEMGGNDLRLDAGQSLRVNVGEGVLAAEVPKSADGLSLQIKSYDCESGIVLSIVDVVGALELTT